MSSAILPIEPDLSALAAEINAAHRAAQEYASKAVERALQAGDLLIKAKSAVQHGQWLPWLAVNCPDIAERTCQQYMKLAANWPLIQSKSAHAPADLTIESALRLIPVNLPMPASFNGWYDSDADKVFSKHRHIRAFRDAIALPDIREKLVTEDILPLAQAIHEELRFYDDHGDPDAVDPKLITAAVKRRFKEAFEKDYQTKRAEQEARAPLNKLIHEVDNAAVCMRKTRASINEINRLAAKNPDLKDYSSISTREFDEAKADLEAAFRGAVEKDITPKKPNSPALTYSEADTDQSAATLSQGKSDGNLSANDRTTKIDRFHSPYGGEESKESGANGKFIKGQTTDSITLFKRPPRFEVFGKLGHIPSQYHAFICGNLYRSFDGWKAAIEYADKMRLVEYPVHLIYPEGWDGPQPNPFYSYEDYLRLFLLPMLKEAKQSLNTAIAGFETLICLEPEAQS